MSLFLEQFKAKFNLGTPHTYRNLTLVPILRDGQGENGYLTLPDALQTGDFVVTEVDAAGSVPEVQVINRLDNAVLLLDGEELVGAKQNRVVNTTILIAAQNKLVIPVSCTEQGRWHETTDQFADSGVVMPPSVRGRKQLRWDSHCGKDRNILPTRGMFGRPSTSWLLLQTFRELQEPCAMYILGIRKASMNI